jgi:hypothetical protein
LDTLHDKLPLRIRFKVKSKVEGFFITAKKHYIYKMSELIKIVGYKTSKSSIYKTVNATFNKTIEILMNHESFEARKYYNSKVRKYSNSQNRDIRMFAYKLSYQRRTYKLGTFMSHLTEHMKSRKVELIPDNSLEVVLVLDRLTYTLKYRKVSPIRLSDFNVRKNTRIYTTDEIGPYSEVIDIVGIFKAQCESDISTLLKAYESPTDNLMSGLSMMKSLEF